MPSFLSGALTALSLLPLSHAFYLPGVAPTDYTIGNKVPLYVNALTPTLAEDQQVRSVMAWDYYHPNFNFCPPKDGPPKKISESLGSILFGDRILTSPFELYMGKNETCKMLCNPVEYSQHQAQFVNWRIWQSYNHNWLIDGLPAAQAVRERGKKDQQTYYVQGFPLGSVEMDDATGNATAFLNNHYDIFVDFHLVKSRLATDPKYRVVGVEVIPSSRQAKLDENAAYGASCQSDAPVVLNSEDTNAKTKVMFTYSVYWRESDTVWATRWDKYLHVYEPSIHWFSLVNSAIIVVFLTGMVAMVVVRALKKDIQRYNSFDIEDDVQDDSGWKLVHGDVFRPPKNPMLLAIFLGSGAQLFFMTGTTIVFALLGFLSPSNRGSLGTVMILLYTVFGFIGGYVSARVYKTLNGDAWKRNILLTPLLVPGIVFTVFFLLNLFLFFEHSSGAVPLTTMLALIAIWFIISVPLSFVGSWFGFRASKWTPPTKTNQIPRQIPRQGKWGGIGTGMVVAGVLPFASIFVELYFIMGSIWVRKVYYMFGFLFLCYGIMIITCSAVTILSIYFLLCAENYHWQWRAFFTSGACALYIVAYALVYWVSKLSLGGFTSNVLYLGYSCLMGFLAWVLTGTIGFFASAVFVNKIYASIKIE
ncbi:hypothetical protein EX30DRAFT_322824 [Ascodesmis nigricans]|uniref:Transmembrane 9 superfamily member n=1 Tax=Ascodesmis nigricans TaxID=341454 RepID=A0A4S2MRZ9_9PEZI|nr:hypothetical protein EX30DRAFT_322824 [Ascodesmis nigricans]